jgi:hypothetical protein
MIVHLPRNNFTRKRLRRKKGWREREEGEKSEKRDRKGRVGGE